MLGICQGPAVYYTNSSQGKYNVKAEVKTKDGDDITCLTAEITFHR